MLGAGHEIRVELARRILHPAGGTETAGPSGALVSLATVDAGRIGMVNTAVVVAVGALGALVVAALVLLRISATLGLLVLVGLPPVLAAVQLLARPLERRSAAEQAGVARAAAVAADLVAGLRLIKGLGAEEAAAARYRQASQGSLENTLRTARVQAAYQGFAVTLTGGFLALVAWVGGRLAAQGSISVGELVAAVGLTQFLIGPFSRLAWVGGVVARARASAGRAATVLSPPPAVRDGPSRLPRPVQGALTLRHVAQGPLRRLDLHIAPGELAGVVVPDPAEAAALLACLARNVDPEAGTVEIDRVPLATLCLDEALGVVLVAPHDARLFAGTLATNVAMGADGDRRRIDAALAAAAADEVAGTLPDGVGSNLTELGRSLSGGQRQRVALARALAADPPVLVLHEPTTACRHRAARGGRAAVGAIRPHDAGGHDQPGTARHR